MQPGVDAPTSTGWKALVVTWYGLLVPLAICAIYDCYTNLGDQLPWAVLFGFIYVVATFLDVLTQHNANQRAYHGVPFRNVAVPTSVFGTLLPDLFFGALGIIKLVLIRSAVYQTYCWITASFGTVLLVPAGVYCVSYYLVKETVGDY